MGYRSDVLLAIVFKDPAHRDEVLAIYALDPRVQKHDLLKDWSKHDHETADAGYYSLWYKGDYVKWYDSYEDVQGYEHLQSVAEEFAGNRDFPYSYIKYRLGEEYSDTEVESAGHDLDGELRDYLYDMVGIDRSINNGFEN